jgi:integrase
MHAIVNTLAFRLFGEESYVMPDMTKTPLSYSADALAVRCDITDTARRAMSPNSWRALKADLKVFASWANVNGVVSLPAQPGAVAKFLRDQAASGKKAATLARYASSISRAHTLASIADPTRTDLVRLELKAQRRALGVRQKQARGLRFRGDVADPLAATGPAGVCVEAMLAVAAETLPGLRDRALMSLAFDTGLRRSEIVAVHWAHIENGNVGAGRLFVPRSKSDQEGAGVYAYLSARSMKALAQLRHASGGDGGPVFRRIHRSRKKDGGDIWTPGAGLTAQSVTLIYRALLDSARTTGLLEDMAQADYEVWRCSLTAHSTRVGLTQDLFAAGEDLAGIMQALRWKSPQQPARYAQALSVESNAAARVVGKL